MSYESLAKEYGRQHVAILEIDADYCSNEFSLAPCTAIGVKCYNTFPTCQDKSNFDRTDNPAQDRTKLSKKTYRFSTVRVDGIQEAGDSPTFPTLKGVTTAPTVLTPSKGFGVRSTLSVVVTDHPWTDIGVDPYFDGRAVPADTIGSFWGKWLSRNKYYEGREVRLLTGYLEADGTFDRDNFRDRLYILNKISGPDASGKVMIEAKDPLKFADNDRKQWPPEFNLVIDEPESTPGAGDEGITETQTVFNYKYSDVYDSDPLDDWFTGVMPELDGVGQEYLIIDEEIMRIQSVAPSTKTLTVVRYTMPTFYEARTNDELVTHDDGSTIQLCYLYEDAPIQNVAYHLLHNVIGVSDDYIKKDKWDEAINDSGYSAYFMSRLLVEPDGCKSYLEELTKHNILLWWDERGQEIKLGTIALESVQSVPYNQNDNIIDGSLKITRNVKARLSRQWVGYGMRNPTRDTDKIRTYRIYEIGADLDAESLEEYNSPRGAKLFSPWLKSNQQAIALEISTRTLLMARDTLRHVSIGLDPKDDAQWTGDVISIAVREIQDEDGNMQVANYLILQAKETISDAGVVYAYELQELYTFDRSAHYTPEDDPGVFLTHGVPADTVSLTHDGAQVTHDLHGTGTEFPDYDEATEEQKAFYGFYCQEDGLMPDGTEGYQYV